MTGAWADDPWRRYPYRWYDERGWTEHVSDGVTDWQDRPGDRVSFAAPTAGAQFVPPNPFPFSETPRLHTTPLDRSARPAPLKPKPLLTPEWWKETSGPLPRWAWLGAMLLGIMLIGALTEDDGASSSESQDEPKPIETVVEQDDTAPITVVIPVETTVPATAAPPSGLPPVAPESLSYLGVSACYPPDPQGWWACSNGVGVVLISPSSDHAAAIQYVGARADYDPSGSSLWSIQSGGVAYIPSAAGFPMFATQPWEGLAQLNPACGPAGICRPPTDPGATTPQIPDTTAAAAFEEYGYGSVAGNDLRIDDLEWTVMGMMLNAPGYSRESATELGASLCVIAADSPTQEVFLLKMLYVSETSGSSVEDIGLAIGIVASSMCYDLLYGLGLLEA